MQQLLIDQKTKNRLAIILTKEAQAAKTQLEQQQQAQLQQEVKEKEILTKLTQ